MDEQPKQTENVLTDYLVGYQQLELDSVQNQLRKTRNAIFSVAALTAVGALILYSMGNILKEDLWLNFIIAAIFFGLALLTKKMPMAFVIITLILYIGIWILTIAVGGTEYIIRGILVKVIVIHYLIKGIGYAREAEELRKKIRADG
jgi:hypothetical protein